MDNAQDLKALYQEMYDLYCNFMKDFWNRLPEHAKEDEDEKVFEPHTCWASKIESWADLIRKTSKADGGKRSSRIKVLHKHLKQNNYSECRAVTGNIARLLRAVKFEEMPNG